MRSIEKYYENTKDALPHKNIKEFIKISDKQGNAIDLGCGAGRDTVFLVKNNWNVLAIDREETKEIISNMLNTEEMKRFRFSSQTFEEIKFDNNEYIFTCSFYEDNQITNNNCDDINGVHEIYQMFLALLDKYPVNKLESNTTK